LSDFIKTTTTIPLPELQDHLSTFPRLWPFPRGDLYHWIPALNRFDDILSQLIEEYELQKPQVRKFGAVLLERAHEAHHGGKAPENDRLSIGGDGDRELVENVLKFTMVLHQNCGNRSLYASSDRLGSLLNTTSLSLLKVTLKLGHLLARRYHSSKQRMASVGSSSLLAAHYNINLDWVRRLAAPFAKPSPALPSTKGKEKAGRPHRASSAGVADGKINCADLVAIVKDTGADDTLWNQWGEVSMTFYSVRPWVEATVEPREVQGFGSPSTPSARRKSNLAPQGPAPLDDVSPNSKSLGTDSSSIPSSVELDIEEISQLDSEELVHRVLDKYNVPVDSQYELLHKIRVAKAFASGKAGRIDMVEIRLLAIANLAYVDSDSTFQQKFSQQDSEQPRRLQLAYQLSDLVHPPDEGAPLVPMDMQTLALATLDALTKQKSRAMDVYTALSANVNHGILFYVVRKGVAQLAVDEETLDVDEEEWREALFSLLSSLPATIPRAGDAMMGAGLMDILVEILGLRTNKAERNHWKVLNFLDSFIHAVRDGYQSFANAKGLDAVKDLTSSTIATSFSRVKSGDVMPTEYKTLNTDYQVPFFQQLTLRWLVKFINYLMQHNGGNFARQLRNLIDSPQILEGLRTILSSAEVFGSNVWSGAVNIFSTFIHNEPTSYSVIAESRLGETFLEAITQKPLPAAKDTTENTKDTVTIQDSAAEEAEPSTSSLSRGILPVSEAIRSIPLAFGALCLNPSGMELVRQSRALECFFKIFESPAHIKVLESEEPVPSQLGTDFDELIRHQPVLRAEILAAVRGMVDRVGRLCHDKAAAEGYGAKLWVEGPNGKLYVAGGRAALAGYHASFSADVTIEDTSDVDMDGDENVRDNAEVSQDEIVKIYENSQGPKPTAYITVATRFLIGFLSNSTMCSAFLDDGGLEYALDLATQPCFPMKSQELHPYDDLSAMLRSLVEQKPHIVVPAIIKRLEPYVDDLRPLLNHKSLSGFFIPFTAAATKASQDSPAILSDGTKYAKALVMVNVLCTALAHAFGQQIYNPRAQSNVFSQVNLADVYVRLIDSLGKLHRICLWEETVLIENMPANWQVKTRVSSAEGFGTDEADDIFGIVHSHTSHSHAAPTENGSPVDSSLGPNGTATSTDEAGETSTMQFENTRVMRHLLCQAPISISAFLQSLGKMILVRRTSDSYQRQNAMKVADSLASWVLNELKYELPREAPARQRYSYWIVILTSTSQLMIDGMRIDT
jgi:E3 ubiquitin-protein ligase HUWE1